MEIIWNRVTEKLPPDEEKDLLVWNGSYMFVSTPYFYSERDKKNFEEVANLGCWDEKHKKIYERHMVCPGKFTDFGQNSYFDDDKVYWAELPKPPGVRLKFTGVVLNLDGVPDASGDIFESDCKIEIPEHVSVYLDFNHIPEKFLGVAKLVREPNIVRYEIHIEGDKISKEVVDSLTPAIDGVVMAREGKKIVSCMIRNVGLCTTPNTDLRIKRIGEQS